MKSLTQFNRGNRNMSPSFGSKDWLGRWGDFFNDVERSINQDIVWPEMKLAEPAIFSPSVDVEESDEMYLISADLPGLKKDNVKIEVSGNNLNISGERSKEVKSEGYYERAHGRFFRSFTLPENVDAKKVEAIFEDGVLRLVLPKVEVQPKQEIKIQSGQPHGLIERFLHREKAVKSEAKPESESEKH